MKISRRRLVASFIASMSPTAFTKDGAVPFGVSVEVSMTVEKVLEQIGIGLLRVVEIIKERGDAATTGNAPNLYRTLLLLVGEKRALARFPEENKDDYVRLANNRQARSMLKSIESLTSNTIGLIQQIDVGLAKGSPMLVQRLSEEVALKQAFVRQGFGTEFSPTSLESAARKLRQFANVFEDAALEMRPFLLLQRRAA